MNATEEKKKTLETSVPVANGGGCEEKKWYIVVEVAAGMEKAYIRTALCE